MRQGTSTERDDHDNIFEGVGDPSNEKTLGERPVSDQDIEDFRDDLLELNEDLADLRKRGAAKGL